MLRLWDADTGQTLSVMQGHVGAVRALAFSSDGTRLASAADDKQLVISSVA
jgi:WD40 repeat protein